MPDSMAKRKWKQENSRNITLTLMTKGDADILDYLEGKTKSIIIKAALREYMARHKEE